METNMERIHVNSLGAGRITVIASSESLKEFDRWVHDYKKPNIFETMDESLQQLVGLKRENLTFIDMHWAGTFDVFLKKPKTKYIEAYLGAYNRRILSMYEKAFNMPFENLNNMMAKKALPLLEKAIREMEDNKEEYEKLNPDPKTGWGNYEGALKYLKGMLPRFQELPTFKVVIY